ncbi:LuxR C-terminal-related transcriptional regulator [Vibrio sp. F74]|uniref:LuxR C-terminal-related transcriptional regulator n=1 Tax=Vibrio sp. F74 TaxID=700020 RepID=UPI0035F5B5C6
MCISDNAQRGIQIVRENDIDLIILDTELKTSSSFDFVRRAKAGEFLGKVLFISNNDHSMVSQTAKMVGANGFISKSENTDVIKDAILAVSRGYSVFKEDLNQAKETVTLSKRESVVYNYLLKGYSNQKISELLSLSAKTISTYKTRILTKYNADSVIQIMNIQNMTPSSIMH